MVKIYQNRLKYQIKRVLKQFAAKWSVDSYDFTRKSLLTNDDFQERVRMLRRKTAMRSYDTTRPL